MRPHLRPFLSDRLVSARRTNLDMFGDRVVLNEPDTCVVVRGPQCARACLYHVVEWKNELFEISIVFSVAAVRSGCPLAVSVGSLCTTWLTIPGRVF